MTNISNDFDLENESLLGELDPDINLLDDAVPHEMCNYVEIDQLKSIIDGIDKFSILNYNICSFHSHGSSFMGALDLNDLDFDCIVLSETWNTEYNYSLCNIPGYDSFHTYRPLDHVYLSSGGISIFCNSSTINQKKFIDDLSFCNAHIETCVVDLLFGNHNVIILGIYRPPRGCKEQFLIDLDRILNVICGSSNKVIVLGDMNLNLYHPDEPILQRYASLLYSKSMVSLINKFTRFPNISNSAMNPSI